MPSEVRKYGRIASPAALAFAFASCQNYNEGYYSAYRSMVGEDLDFVVHLGDYIYEGNGQGSIGRGHAPAVDVRTLAEYRVRHAQYKTDPDLQAAHGLTYICISHDSHLLSSVAPDIVIMHEGRIASRHDRSVPEGAVA